MAKESEITLLRRYLGDAYTVGTLSIEGVAICDTLEDVVRDHNKDGDLDDPGEGKVYGETAIPYGRYKVSVSMSPKFKRVLPRLVDVKGFEGILIHRGTTAKDTHGCILVGENKIKGGLINSTPYEEMITGWIRIQEKIGYTVYIKII